MHIGIGVMKKFIPIIKIFLYKFCLQPLDFGKGIFYSLYSIYKKRKDDRSKISIALNSYDFQKSNFHCWYEHKTKCGYNANNYSPRTRETVCA